MFAWVASTAKMENPTVSQGNIAVARLQEHFALTISVVSNDYPGYDYTKATAKLLLNG